MSELVKIRQNIHTYPFRYQQRPDGAFFAPQSAAIYIHIPFCSTKCHFCDFTVYTNQGQDAQAAYVDRLCKEIQRFSRDRRFPAYDVQAIYFGGGTPGLLSSAQLLQILDVCRDHYSIASGCEIAVEFDPKSTTLEKLSALYEGGFTRFSMGVQSFDNELLERSNRPHGVDDIGAAMAALRSSGFRHTNLDLLYPLPGLTHTIWADSVERTIDLELACVSLYGLEVWPGTAYYNWLKKGRLPLPTSSVEVEMYEHAVSRLEEEGYVAGSVNGYVHPERADRYCRFLEFYWRTLPVIGFGVSARSSVSNRLWTNVKSIQDYLHRIDHGESTMDFGTVMSKPQEMRRVMIRGIKTCEVGKAEFFERFGIDMEAVFSKELAGLESDDLIVNEPKRIVLTRRGRSYAPTVYQRFFVQEDQLPPAPGDVQYGISHLVSEA